MKLEYSRIPCCCCKVASVVSDSVRPHRQQPTQLRHPRDSPVKNTGVGWHFLLQCMKVKSEREVAQSCPMYGKIQSLGSLKSFLWHAPQPSGASILCFLILNPLTVHCQGWLQQFLDGRICFHPELPQGSHSGDSCNVMAWWQQHLFTEVASNSFSLTLFHFGCNESNSLCYPSLWPLYQLIINEEHSIQGLK